MKCFWQQLPEPFLVLAPMEDVTDPVFRQVAAAHLPRPDVFFTEFTNTDALCSAGREAAEQKLRFTPKERPIVAQIWGKNPDHYFEAAQLVAQLGYDGIDINMGCPERNVVKNGCGAGMIGNFELVSAVLDAVKRGAPTLPLSVKTRIGIKTVVTQEWASFLLQQQLAALTIHGRTAKQMSAVPADWNEIKKVVELRNALAPQTVIIGNGDVLSYQQAVAYREQFGVDGVMIGRGIFNNPWVFDKTLPPRSHELQDSLQVLQEHVKLFMREGNPRKFNLLKKFFKMYVKEFAGASELRTRLMECESPEAVLVAVTGVLHEHV